VQAAGAQTSRFWFPRRSTMATSTLAIANSPATIIPVGPPPAITTACPSISRISLIGCGFERDYEARPRPCCKSPCARYPNSGERRFLELLLARPHPNDKLLMGDSPQKSTGWVPTHPRSDVGNLSWHRGSSVSPRFSQRTVVCLVQSYWQAALVGSMKLSPVLSAQPSALPGTATLSMLVML
jgi:hypothetical protein